ncbi:MAG: PqqD family protein [Bryobacteraceae bacterium]
MTSTICGPSPDVVARVVEGGFLLVLLGHGPNAGEDDVCFLNEGSREIWERIDGKKTLGAIAAGMAAEFDAPASEIERDVCQFAASLLERKFLIVLP